MKKNYLVKRMAVCLMAAVMSVGAVMTGNLAATPTAAYAQEYLYEGILDISSKGWTKYSTGLNYDMTGGTAGTLSQGARLFVISEKTNRAGNKVSYVYSEDLKKNCYVTSKYIAKVDEKTTEKRGMLTFPQRAGQGIIQV